MAAVKAKKPVSKLKAGQKKKTNKWLIIGGVAAVAIIGAVVVRFSGASSYPFINGISKMAYQNGSAPVVKSGGVSYKPITSNLTLATLVSKSQVSRASTVCAHFKVLAASTNVMSIQQVDASGKGRNYGSKPLRGLKVGSTASVCTSGVYRGDNTTRVYGVASGKMGIDTIYGKY